MFARGALEKGVHKHDSNHLATQQKVAGEKEEQHQHEVHDQCRTPRCLPSQDHSQLKASDGCAAGHPHKDRHKTLAQALATHNLHIPLLRPCDEPPATSARSAGGRSTRNPSICVIYPLNGALPSTQMYELALPPLPHLFPRRRRRADCVFPYHSSILQ